MFFGQHHSNLGSSVSIRLHKLIEGLEERLQVKMSRSLLLLISRVFYSLCCFMLHESSIGFLLLDLRGKCSLSNLSKFIVLVVLTPIWEVTLSIHVSLGKSIDLKSRYQEIKFCLNVTNEVSIVSGVVDEVLTWFL